MNGLALDAWTELSKNQLGPNRKLRLAGWQAGFVDAGGDPWDRPGGTWGWLLEAAGKGAGRQVWKDEPMEIVHCSEHSVPTAAGSIAPKVSPF